MSVYVKCGVEMNFSLRHADNTQNNVRTKIIFKHSIEIIIHTFAIYASKRRRFSDESWWVEVIALWGIFLIFIYRLRKIRLSPSLFVVVIVERAKGGKFLRIFSLLNIKWKILLHLSPLGLPLLLSFIFCT